MQFSTVATVAAVAAVANAQYNSTVTSTATENLTTLVTITSCEDHICKETVSPALVSTATVTVDNVVTQYTTWCPLSAAANTTVATSSAHISKNATSAASTKHSVSSYHGAGAKALPAAGALLAGAAAFLL
ncbi:Ccw12p PWA37_004978 [Arxiozyma heterogenica]|uniref:Uncharacterized protein n=1 Tax=Arxiozyma heterogenica TaxID=278026 RepID=A0AAN7WIS9_9SACH|nr:hypothetical protein RI543_005004 [Kazachstania heterogenica]